MLSEEAAYAYEINGHGTGLFVSLKHALLMDEWDYVVMQQCSPQSGEYDKYQPYLSELAAYVRRLCPPAKLVMQMTWTGAPTIYYGDEAGLCGFTDPDNRRTYPWGREDHELTDFHKAVIRIHKENRELKIGSLMKLGADYQFLAYARFTRNEWTVVVINNHSHEITKEISVWEAGISDGMLLRRILLSYEDGFTMNIHDYSVKGGTVTIQMSSHSALVLKAVCET